MNKIGILQGRLLPSDVRRLQVFPAETWEKEFGVAQDCGFSVIELLLDIENYAENPLMRKEGQERIVRLSAESGLLIDSVCADFFKKYGFFGNGPQVRESNATILKKLIKACGAIHCPKILLPFFEETEIKTEKDKQEIVRSLSGFYGLLRDYGVTLCLETTLPAPELVNLLTEINHPNIKIYYDLGNSIPLKYDAADDIRALSQWLGGIHVKDRNSSGDNVILGTGMVDFRECFQALQEIHYQGTYILETAMGDDPIATAKCHLGFVNELLGMKLTAGSKPS